MSVRDRHEDDLVAGHRLTDPGAASILDVQIRFTPNLPVVRLGGELDVDSVHLVRDALDCVASMSSRARLIVLDLSGVTFCDVGGLRGIETCAGILEAGGRQLVLHRLPQRLMKLIALSGVASGLERH